MKKAVLLFCALPLLLPGISTARDKDLEKRLEGLEQKWEQFAGSEVERNAKLAEAFAQLERLQNQLQALGGGTESQGVQMQQVKGELERLFRDLEMRVNTLESQLKIMQGGAASPSSPSTGAIQEGFNSMQSGDYAKAIASLQQYVKLQPKGASTADAYFWIGECRFALRDYAQAIKDYQAFVERYPKSDKAPVAILKQGESFSNMKMKQEAKVFWTKLAKEYPNSPEARQAKAKLEGSDKPAPAPKKEAPEPSEF